MRKNTARHWLHAALDLLPVILIPVFMIYSHRHTLTEQTTVEIQYKYQSNEVNSVDDLIEGNIYKFNISDTTIDNYIDNDDSISIECLKVYDYDFSNYNFDIDDIIYNYQTSPGITSVNFNFYSFSSSYASIYLYGLDEEYFISIDLGDLSEFSFTFVCDCVLYSKNLTNSNVSFLSSSDYNEIENVDVQDTNSSVMNVFMDDFNYSVNKYFNMGNVFNLKDVYHWFEVNIFNNNPPVVMSSIYNIIVYEFVMDLLFLLYGLFMWFVDMLKRLIEKPIDSIK